MKRISILGSTGSIGTQTLEVIRFQNRTEEAFKAEEIEVSALAAGSNIELLYEQILEFHPKLVCVWSPQKAEELKKRLKKEGILPCPELQSGMEGLVSCATMPEISLVVTAVVGMIGLRPTIAAIEAGKDIALANKETLVTAGHLIMPLAKKRGVQILPVDSEHSAIFQCLNGESGNPVTKLLLTASGGPFRGKKKSDLGQVTVEDALRHPNWSMGKKITIDSATMVNKGLEVMEAHWLFGVAPDQIQVVVQPKSIIHSMVEFADGAVIAQLGTPDMKLPISYALFYPERKALPGERLDFWSLTEIAFEKPDLETFEGLLLAYEAAQTGGGLPTVFNAANERSVAMFLNREIGFLDILSVIRGAMDWYNKQTGENAEPDLDTILELEQETYDWIEGTYRRNQTL